MAHRRSRGRSPLPPCPEVTTTGRWLPPKAVFHHWQLQCQNQRVWPWISLSFLVAWEQYTNHTQKLLLTWTKTHSTAFNHHLKSILKEIPPLWQSYLLSPFWETAFLNLNHHYPMWKMWKSTFLLFLILLPLNGLLKKDWIHLFQMHSEEDKFPLPSTSPPTHLLWHRAGSVAAADPTTILQISRTRDGVKWQQVRPWRTRTEPCETVSQ